MNNRKTLIVLLMVLALIIVGSVYLWQSSKSDIQPPTSETTQPQESAGVEAPKSTADNETKKQERETDTSWKMYSSKEGGVSFEYPQQFFLLDRSEDDKRIYISPREISFNDFAGGYYEPIEISFKDESESNSMIQALENKKVSKTTMGSKNVLVFSGTIPENPPYYAFNVFAIFFPEQEISIIAANRFNQDGNSELETVASKIAATLVIE